MPSFTIIMIAGALFTMLGLVIFAFAGPSAAKAKARRLEGLRERHSKSSEVAAQVQMKRILAGRSDTKMDGIAKRLLPNPALLRLRLSRTGRSWTLGQYLMACGGLAILVMTLLTMKGLPFILGLFVGLFAGLGIPHFVVGFLIKRRINQFTSKFPDAIELMVRGLRSGLPISETLGIVASEVPGPVGIEFRSVSDKMKIGRTMESALQDTADRLGTPEFQFFVITLAIQRETGGNLAETLSNLADVLRKRAQMKLKIRAMSSEAKASAMILGILPFAVFTLLYLMNPGYMGGFFSDPRLIVAGLGGILWMSIGVFVMAKMVNFEI
ncbi:MAG TPA: type II secretion system F family protein [Allosphingosinicella sp.]|uniref:type II secretion system F family protein n=1 Tax=Allosphingosinicella sp. TaxID=2823234 RepID=UPI002ED8A0D4